MDIPTPHGTLDILSRQPNFEGLHSCIWRFKWERGPRVTFDLLRLAVHQWWINQSIRHTSSGAVCQLHWLPSLHVSGEGALLYKLTICFPGWYFVVFTMGIFGRRKIFLSYVASLSHAYAGIVRASSQDVSVQLSQELFYENGTVYDQLLILNSDFIVDPDLLAEQGLPFYASTWVIHLLVSNLGMAATFTHLLLWNRKDLEAAWSWMRPSGLRRMWANRKSFDWRIWKDGGMRNREVVNADAMKEMDPHYREMLKYADAPNSWYATILLCACIAALVVIYKTDSTLPWYATISSRSTLEADCLRQQVGFPRCAFPWRALDFIFRGAIRNHGIKLQHSAFCANDWRLHSPWQANG